MSTPQVHNSFNYNGGDKWRKLIAVLVTLATVFAGGAFTLELLDDDGDGHTDGARVTVRTKAPPVQVKVNEAPDDGAPTVTTQVPAAAVERAAQGIERDLHDETPVQAQAAPDSLKNTQEQVQTQKRTAEPLPTAGASAGFTGCRTRFVGNQSSRRGVRPKYQVVHYTVSPNVPGWSDVNAIVALFDRASSQASSTFVIDREGNCAYIVPIEAKPWTQAAGNPLSVSYEVVNSGRESSFMDSAGYAKLRSVMREVSRRTGIPMRKGNVSTGRSGIVQHKDGGLAWGGHVDVTPYSIDSIVKIVTAGSAPSRSKCTKLDTCYYANLSKLTKGERENAKTLLSERRTAVRHHGWQKVAPSHLHNAERAKRALGNRRTELRRLGLTNKNNRKLRYTVMGRVITP